MPRVMLMRDKLVGVSLISNYVDHAYVNHVLSTCFISKEKRWKMSLVLRIYWLWEEQRQAITVKICCTNVFVSIRKI